MFIGPHSESRANKGHLMGRTSQLQGLRDASGALLGFALTGEATKQKMALQKELPAIMA